MILKAWAVVALCSLLASSSRAQSTPPPPSYQEAASLIEKRQIQPAIALLQAMLERSPQDLRAHNLMGIALTTAGKLEDANAHFQQAISLNPRFYPALKNLALNEMRLNRIEEAKAHFSLVLQFGPQDPVVHLALGEIYFQGKQFREAVTHYDQSQDLPFRNPRMVLNYAASCLEVNQPAKALGLLGKLPPEADAHSHFEAGMIFARLEKYESAAGEFERARQNYPDPYEVTFNLTLAYLKSRNFAAAIRTAQAFLSPGNQRAELYNVLAQAYEGNGQTVEAYNALRIATQLEPKDENNYLDLAALCVDHANYDLGVEILNIGIKHLSRSARLYIQRGTLLALKGESAQALADFETAGQLAPDHGLAQVARGLVLLEVGENAKAVEILRRQAATSPRDYLVHYILGEAINRTGAEVGSPEEAEAVQALVKSVELKPGFGPSHATLGKLLLRRNEVDRAIAELERALALDPGEVSSLYQLALAVRKKGDAERAKEIFAQVNRAKTEERDKFLSRTLIRVVREESK